MSSGRTDPGRAGAVVHRIEALPGAGRYAVTFRRPDGGEHSAVVHVRDDGVDVAEASLPPGWTRDGAAFVAAVDALAALQRSREASQPTGRVLRDVDGGWDVSLGNVVPGPDGEPRCIAHGPLEPGDGTEWVCPECGARAAVA